MPHQYSTALSHLILAGTGIYCLIHINGESYQFPHVTFGIITINSVIGVWRWGNPKYGDNVEKIYKFTSYLQFLFAMPCITTTVWLANGYDRNLSLGWTVLPFAALMISFFDNSTEISDLLMQMLIPIGLTALGAVSLLVENFYGVATAVSYAIDHYCVMQQREYDIPAQDLYNYGLCFFSYFALRAIRD